jgi:Mycotoxin biosynthesis protein UstYa
MSPSRISWGLEDRASSSHDRDDERHAGDHYFHLRSPYSPSGRFPSSLKPLNGRRYSGEKATLISPTNHRRHAHNSASACCSPLLLSVLLFTSALMNITLLLKLYASPPAPRTHSQTFTLNTSYSSTRHSTDTFWSLLINPTNASHPSIGQIWTTANRADHLLRPAGMAMFHQLHCLAGLRSAIQQLQDGKEIGYDIESDVSDHAGHWPHCLDYLRQVLLCYADGTVETSEEVDGQWRISGYDVPRLCGDSRALYEVTACGEGGCEGGRYYVPPRKLEMLKAELNVTD